MQPIELRSDTFSLPTEGMKKAMFSAPLGDDVFGEDPSVNLLEEKLSKLFGMEAGLFCPSGTMTNQIAMMTHCNPGDEIICEQFAHVYRYEGGGMMTNAMASPKLILAENGLINVKQLTGCVNNPNDPHFPLTRLVCLENTANQGGGTVYPKSTLEDISSFCSSKKLMLHLDGARIFNALAYADYDARFIGQTFDSVSVCLSKGLGSPVGSVLLGSKDFILKSRRIRKRIGGGMRQAGILASAGIYALDHHIDRLQEDHDAATFVADKLKTKSWVSQIKPVQTNILIFETACSAWGIVEQFARQGLKCLAIGENQIRFVFHIGVSQEQVKEVIKIIDKIEG